MSEVAEGRVPPNDLDAEAVVISSALLSSDGYDAVEDILRPDMFYAEANGSIWEAIQALNGGAKRVDMQSVAGWLRDKGKLQQVGGTPYLVQLCDATPALANVEQHARRVRDKHRRRALIQFGQRVAGEGYGDVGSTDDWMQACEAELYAIADDRAERRDVDVKEAADRCAQAIVRRALRQDPAGRDWCLRKLTSLTGGRRDGKLYVLAGRPGMGKTSLALQEALFTAESGDGVGFFSLEMTENVEEHELTERFISQISGIDGRRIASGRNIGKADREAIEDARKHLRKLPIKINDTAGITVTAVRSQVRRWSRQFQAEGKVLRLVAIDYLTLMGTHDVAGRNDSDNVAIGKILKRLVALGKEFGCAILLLSQLNRGVESRSDPGVYKLSDLRDSGSIEQDAYGIFFVHRNFKAGTAKIQVAKARGGETGDVEGKFEGKSVTFVEESWVPDSEAWDWADDNFDEGFQQPSPMPDRDPEPDPYERRAGDYG